MTFFSQALEDSGYQVRSNMSIYTGKKVTMIEV
jgi:hypothetical protein